MSMEYENYSKAEREESISKVSEVEGIKESRNRRVRTREELAELVEEPLLSACEELYDKNIRTLSTSANGTDITYYGRGHIAIDYDTLSEENKKIAERLGNIVFADNMNQLDIVIPLNESSTVDEIKQYAESIAHQFQKQKMLWVPTFTIEDLRVMYRQDPDDEEWGPDAFEDLWYHDMETDTFFLSEEHAQKSKGE